MSAPPARCDIAVIGGGIVGLATAMALPSARPPRSSCSRPRPASPRHQTGHNSGVIHSGLYYKPGSLKARNCVEGREALYASARSTASPTSAAARWWSRRARARAAAPRRARAPRARQRPRRACAARPGATSASIEPHAAGIAGLFVPRRPASWTTPRVAEALCRRRARGGRRDPDRGARDGAAPRRRRGRGSRRSPARVRCRTLVNCAGLHSDRVARLARRRARRAHRPLPRRVLRARPARQHLVAT